MLLQVVGHTTEKGLPTKMIAQHTNYRASLQIADMVKNLVYFESVPYGNFNRVRCAQGIELKRLLYPFSLRDQLTTDGQ